MSESYLNICPTSQLEYETNYSIFKDLNLFGNGNFSNELKNCHNVGTEPVFPATILMSVAQLLSHLGSHEPGVCAVVLFYATWCPFSMKMAADYNALGRLFPTIPIIAVEVEAQINTFSSNQLRFGTISVPNLLIFQGPRAISRYNQTHIDLQLLTQFMKQHINIDVQTHCSPNVSTCSDIEIMEQDHIGPLPTKLQTDTDWILIFSILFLMYIVFTKVKTAVV